MEEINAINARGKSLLAVAREKEKEGAAIWLEDAGAKVIDPVRHLFRPLVPATISEPGGAPTFASNPTLLLSGVLNHPVLGWPQESVYVIPDSMEMSTQWADEDAISAETLADRVMQEIW